MGEKNEPKTDRKWTVLRLYPEDFRLIRQLGEGEERAYGLDNRDACFRALIPLAEKLKLTWMATPQRLPQRVSMPDDLDKILTTNARMYNCTKVYVLMELVKLFRKEYKPPEDEKKLSVPRIT